MSPSCRLLKNLFPEISSEIVRKPAWLGETAIGKEKLAYTGEVTHCSVPMRILWNPHPTLLLLYRAGDMLCRANLSFHPKLSGQIK